MLDKVPAVCGREEGRSEDNTLDDAQETNTIYKWTRSEWRNGSASALSIAPLDLTARRGSCMICQVSSVRRAEGEECQGKASPKVSNALKRKHKPSVTTPQFS